MKRSWVEVKKPIRAILLISAVLTVLALVGRVAPGRRVARGASPERSVPDVFRRFVTYRFDPLVVTLGLVGGKRSPWALLEHVGRSTGQVRRTPVLPSISDGHVNIALPYGRGAQWVRNVISAGGCRVQSHGIIYVLDEPQVVPAADVPDPPKWREERRSGRLDYLSLRVFSEQPGRLEDVPRGAASRRTEGATASEPDTEVVPALV